MSSGGFAARAKARETATRIAAAAVEETVLLAAVVAIRVAKRSEAWVGICAVESSEQRKLKHDRYSKARQINSTLTLCAMT